MSQERRSDLTTFLILVYVISWSLWAPVVLLFPDTSAPPWWALVLAAVGAYGPSLAAMITALVCGKLPGLAALFTSARGRAGWPWYLLVLLGPPAFVWIAAGTQVLLGGNARFVGAQSLVKMALILATFVPFGPLGEELGWRGYALPRLEQHFAPLVSGLVLGIIWAAWHLPMFWFPPIGLPRRSLANVAMWAVNVVGFSVLLSYVARRTKYSVPIAILLHATLNAGPAMGRAVLVSTPADLQAIGNKAQIVRWVVVFVAALMLARDGWKRISSRKE